MWMRVGLGCLRRWGWYVDEGGARMFKEVGLVCG